MIPRGRSTALDRIDAVLNLAEDQLQRAHDAEQKADALHERTRAMYETNHADMATESKIRARATLKRSAVTLQRGRLLEDADTLRQRVSDRTDWIGRLQRQETELRGNARELRQAATEAVRKASGATSYAPLPEQIAARRAELPALRERAAQRDAERYTYLTDRATDERRTATSETQRAGGLRDEAARRSQFTPKQRAKEIKQRNHAIRKAQAAQQAAVKRGRPRRSATAAPLRHALPRARQQPWRPIDHRSRFWSRLQSRF